MLAAVKLDDHARIGARKIDDVAADRNLTLEFPSAETAVAQAQPQDALDIRLMPPQTPRTFNAFCYSVHTQRNPVSPSPHPSPQWGEGVTRGTSSTNNVNRIRGDDWIPCHRGRLLFSLSPLGRGPG